MGCPASAVCGEALEAAAALSAGGAMPPRARISAAKLSMGCQSSCMRLGASPVLRKFMLWRKACASTCPLATPNWLSAPTACPLPAGVGSGSPGGVE
eukprot:4622930-Pyramimonas_sp.AAC.1